MVYSLYFHIPFCRHRCSYCDFNTYARLEELIPAYMQALEREVALVSSGAGKRLPVHTIFFGGGTPSLIPPKWMSSILDLIHSVFALTIDAEITLEANPGSVTDNTLAELFAAGFNRISFGMQSAHPDDLRLLERQHDYFDVVQAVRMARRAGFDNISLDLIYGIPFQDLSRWERTLKHAIDLKPEHLSLYALTIEHGTPFQHFIERGLVPVPDDDLAADMYELAGEVLIQAGYQQYEISNWARHRDGNWLVARHNLQYWRGLPYFGFGAGAHGYVNRVRTANILGVKAYIDRVNGAHIIEYPAGPAASQVQSIDLWGSMQETMMMGLRLTDEGVSDTLFKQEFGIDLKTAFPDQIHHLTQAGLLEWTGTQSDSRLRLTKRAYLLGNQVFSQFVGNSRPSWLSPDHVTMT